MCNKWLKYRTTDLISFFPIFFPKFKVNRATLSQVRPNLTRPSSFMSALFMSRLLLVYYLSFFAAGKELDAPELLDEVLTLLKSVTTPGGSPSGLGEVGVGEKSREKSISKRERNSDLPGNLKTMKEHVTLKVEDAMEEFWKEKIGQMALANVKGEPFSIVLRRQLEKMGLQGDWMKKINDEVMMGMVGQSKKF